MYNLHGIQRLRTWDERDMLSRHLATYSFILRLILDFNSL